MVVEGKEEGTEGVCLMSVQCQLHKLERVLEMDGGGGCTKL